LRVAVRKVKVYTSSNPSENPFDQHDGSFNDQLNVFSSTTDFSTPCLAHLFVSTTFSGGVVGLAWVGDASPSRPGGICHRSSNLWLNTGESRASRRKKINK
jgi:hypothetical protein